MIELLAFSVVLFVGLYFVALGIASLLAPARTKRFLLGFAGSAPKHYTELLARFIAGGAFLVHAPRVPFADAFSFFGWLLVLTSAGLLLIPWQWHHRFAQQTVPRAIRHIGLIGLCALMFGGLLLAAVLRGAAV